MNYGFIECLSVATRDRRDAHRPELNLGGSSARLASSAEYRCVCQRCLVSSDNKAMPIMVDPERTPLVAGDCAKAPSEEPGHHQKRHGVGGLLRTEKVS